MVQCENKNILLFKKLFYLFYYFIWVILLDQDAGEVLMITVINISIYQTFIDSQSDKVIGCHWLVGLETQPASDPWGVGWREKV